MQAKSAKHLPEPICPVCHKAIPRKTDSEWRWKNRKTCRPSDTPKGKVPCTKIHATIVMKKAAAIRIEQLEEARKNPKPKADPHASQKAKQQKKALTAKQREKLDNEQAELNKRVYARMNMPLETKIYTPEEREAFAQQYLQR